MYAISLIRPIVRGHRVKVWSMTWRDPTTRKKKKKTTGTTSKALARAIAQQQHEKLVRRAHGLSDPFEEQQNRRIDEHLADYEKALSAKKRNGDYIEQTIKRAERLIEACGWQTISEISSHEAELALGRLTDLRSKKKLSNGARNGYLTSVKSFCSWLVRSQRVAINPLIGMEKLNAETDRKRVRRPLTPAECDRLVTAAKAGPVVEGMPGRERALAYVVAAYTGYRRRSLQSLRVCDFDFDRGTVTLPPKATKNGKVTNATPLHPSIIAAIRKAAAGLAPEERVLPRLTKHASADGIKVDLEAAGIPIKDSRGRVVDLHALRGTFSTWLKDTGTSLQDAQKLMHHSDPRLTANTYTTTSTEAARAAISRLPTPPSLD